CARGHGLWSSPFDSW
nr:immunoglobulin heavy chain junction region [Macaca mulatta]MOX63136.1 immunoglobulin heavy chain junction region [Macaca mulatta]MOX67144.1 immunoglobulin heavy chain junction region [Macaca mulatta]